MKRLHRRLWPWLLFAVAVAAAAWVWLGRPSPSPSVPVPGRPLETPGAREEIRDAERERLSDILEERGSSD